MGRRRKRIVARRLKERREAAQLVANPILSQENSVAQEALKEAIKPPEITLSIETPEEATTIEVQTTPSRKITKRVARKTIAKKASPKRTTRRRTKTNTQTNSSK